jgi:hypothetical protein
MHTTNKKSAKDWRLFAKVDLHDLMMLLDQYQAEVPFLPSPATKKHGMKEAIRELRRRIRVHAKVAFREEQLR